MLNFILTICDSYNLRNESKPIWMRFANRNNLSQNEVNECLQLQCNSLGKSCSKIRIVALLPKWLYLWQILSPDKSRQNVATFFPSKCTLTRCSTARKATWLLSPPIKMQQSANFPPKKRFKGLTECNELSYLFGSIIFRKKGAISLTHHINLADILLARLLQLGL